MQRWARDFDSWDVVDASCCYLYAAAAPAWQKAESWSRRPAEFVKRAAFSLVAYLSYKDKQAFGRQIPALLTRNRTGSPRRKEFRAQGRELGAAEHWQPKFTPESRRDSRSGTNPPAKLPVGSLDRRGRPPRVAKRRGASPTPAQGS